MTTDTPDSLWATLAPLVVLPDGSRPLMEPCPGVGDFWCFYIHGGISCEICRSTGRVPIPRSLSAALAAMGAMGWQYEIIGGATARGPAMRLLIVTPDGFYGECGCSPDEAGIVMDANAAEFAVYEAIPFALGVKEKTDG